MMMTTSSGVPGPLTPPVEEKHSSSSTDPSMTSVYSPANIKLHIRPFDLVSEVRSLSTQSCVSNRCYPMI
jgi:hypothetical protein